jgi:hypothetical protein
MQEGREGEERGREQKKRCVWTLEGKITGGEKGNEAGGEKERRTRQTIRRVTRMARVRVGARGNPGLGSRRGPAIGASSCGGDAQARSKEVGGEFAKREKANKRESAGCCGHRIGTRRTGMAALVDSSRSVDEIGKREKRWLC